MSTDEVNDLNLNLSRIQTNTFVDCAAWLLTVLIVLPRRHSLVFSVLN